MKLFKIVLQIGILYGFYYVGTWIQRLFDLFIPGSIIGMLLLLTLLVTNVLKTDWLDSGTSVLLNHMPLLFIPVTVGVLNYFDVFAGEGFLLIVIVLVSTVIVMLSSATISQYLTYRKERR